MQRVIIVFKKGMKNTTIVEAVGGKIVNELISMPTLIIADINTHVRENLETHPNIVSVFDDKEMEMMDESSDDPPDSPYAWQIPALNAKEYWERGLTGKGIKVAVVDNGIGYHKSLEVVGGVDFINPSNPDYRDASGGASVDHGSRVASSIASKEFLSSDGYIIRGIAPDVELYSVKTEYNLSTALLGYDWCINNNIDIAIYSAGTNYGEISIPYEIGIQALLDAGVMLFNAVGNIEEIPEFQYPTRVSGVIGVSGLRINSSDEYETTGSSGRYVDFIAPSSSVKLASSFGKNSTGSGNSNGTSFANPMVAGVFANYMQAFPDKTNQQIYDMIKDSTLKLNRQVGDRDNQHGWGIPRPSPEILALRIDDVQHEISNLSETSIGLTSTLSWVGSADSYNVYMNGTLIGNTTAHNYTIEDLSPLTNYRFKITTVIDGVESKGVILRTTTRDEDFTSDQEIITSGLVINWDSKNRTEGNTWTNAVSGAQGQYVGSMLGETSSIFPDGVRFNTPTDKVVTYIPEVFNTVTPFTLEIRFIKESGNRGILSSDVYGAFLTSHTNGNTEIELFSLDWNEGGEYGTVHAYDNTITHLTYTYDPVSGVIKAYLDGEYISAQNVPKTLTLGIGSTTIALSDIYEIYPFKGYIQMFRLYSEVLSESEVLHNYKADMGYELPPLPLSEITNLSETHTSNSISLSWVNPTEANFSHINIYSNDILIRIGVTDTSVTIDKLEPSTDYGIRIVTVDDLGIESEGIYLLISTKDETGSNGVYLYMDGVDDTFRIPQLVFNKIVMEMKVYYGGSHSIQQRYWSLPLSESSVRRDAKSFAHDVVNVYSDNISSVLIDGEVVENNTKFMPLHRKVIMESNLSYKPNRAIDIFSSNGNSLFVRGAIYDIKVYNDDNLVAHYDMTQGHTKDLSGNGRDVTLTGGTWEEDSKECHLYMDGIDDRLDIPAVTHDRLEVEFLLGDYPRHATSADLYYGTVLGKEFETIRYRGLGATDYIFYTDASEVYIDKILARHNTNFFKTDTRQLMKANMTKDITKALSIFGSAVNSAVGGRFNTNGILYNIKLYNGESLVAHYDMSKGTVEDQTGNGHHATLYGGTWIGDESDVPIGADVSYDYDTRQCVYANRTSLLNTAQKIIVNKSDIFMTQQGIYASRISSFFTGQKMHEVVKLDNALKQTISLSRATEHVTTQAIHTTRIKDYATLQLIFSDFVHVTIDYPVQIKINEEQSNDFDTIQKMIESRSTKYATTQVTTKTQALETILNQIIYKSRQMIYDTQQTVHANRLYDYPIVILTFNPDKVIVSRVTLKGSRELDIDLTGSREMITELRGGV